MNYYTLSYDLKNTEYGDYRNPIINFLLDNQAIEIHSTVATTIYFTSNQDFNFWVEALTSLQADIRYFVAQIAIKDDGDPIMDGHHKKTFRENFDNDVQTIKDQREENDTTE